MRGNTFTVLSVLSGAMLMPWSMAGAASLELQVLLNGEQAGVYDSTDLGCTDVAGTPVANCSGTEAVWIGGQWGMTLNSWNLQVDTDPVISGTVSVTNVNSSTQQFTLIFGLPIAPPIPGSTLIGGSMQAGATDLNGDGVTLGTGATSAFYTALIDGADVQTLYAGPQSFSAGNFLSVNVPSVAFGTPIPSQIGPAALSTIGIRLDFTLSGNDTATFTSNFVVEPATTVIPVPAAVWLFGSAVGILGWLRRRSAHAH